MSAGTPTPADSLSPDRASRGRMDQFVDRQLRRTQWQVKLVDFCTALVGLAAGLLTALLALVVVDHWVFGLGSWARMIAAVSLVLGVGWYTAVVILPLLFRSINPLYAARTIEQCTPSLKNSLINFLLLRSHREGVRAGVFAAVQDRAAADLTRVSVENVVDRSRLIQAGYVLAALVTIGAAYVVLSPKNVFQTLSRIAVPLADIPRPARVTIAGVLPGDAEVFQGQEVTITAQVTGVEAGDPVTLFFSTADRQAVDRPLEFTLDENQLKYTCQLARDGRGIQQDTVYRIAAGDAVTRDYRLRVSPSPAITVERVEYDFPAHTNWGRRVLERDGNLRALEGTRVTVRARANYALRSAWVEFDPPPASSDRGQATGSPGERVPMQVLGDSAWQSFVLKLDAGRQTPWHTRYQLTFSTLQGQSSQNHVVYQIEVIRDLPPEVQILTPSRDRIELPENGEQLIEVRATDPDFGLSEVRLKAVVGGGELLDHSLLSPQGAVGQIVGKYAFRPQQLGLVAGNQVVYWAVAEDNRISPGLTSPEPNTDRTRNYTLLITQAADGTSRDTPDKPDPTPQPVPPKPSSDAQQSDQSQGSPADPSTAATPKDGSKQDGSAGSADQQQSAGAQKGQGQDSPQSTSAQDPGDPSAGSQGSRQDSARASKDGQGDSSPRDGQTDPSQNADGSSSDLLREPLHDGEVFEKALEQMKQQPGQEETPADSNASQQEPAIADDRLVDQPRASKDASSGSTQDHSPAAEDASSTASPAGKDSGSIPPQAKPRPAEAMRTPPASAAEAGSESGQAETEPRDAGRPKRTPRPDSQHGTGMGTQQDRTPQGTSAAKDNPQASPPSSTDSSPEAARGSEQGQQPSDRQGGVGPDPDQGGQKAPNQHAEPAPGGGVPGQAPAQNGDSASPTPKSGDSASKQPQGVEAEKNAAAADHQEGPASGTQGRSAEKQADSKPQAPTPKSADRKSEQGPPSLPKDSQPRDPGQGEPTGGGTPGSSPASKQTSAPDVPASDAPNLDYARRATELVLEYLREQQDQPDPKLMRELGWSPEDLRQFIERWQRLKDSAHEGEVGRQELDETLRSLGLRPASDRLRRGSGRSDELGGLRNTGSRSAPPLQYQEQFDAFRKGAARSATSP